MTRQVYGIFLPRKPKLELTCQTLELISAGQRIAGELATGIYGWRFELGVLVQDEVSGFSA